MKIENIENCTGCSACFSICPLNCVSMKPNQNGFLYPTIDNTNCVDCGKCVSVCPLSRTRHKIENRISYAAVNNDALMRENSSSGGIFGLLAKVIIQQRGVVFGASFDDSFIVKHGFIEKENDIPKLQGSKYVQTQMENSFRQVKQYLENGRIVFFSGTPCQINGLISYLNKPYDKLITQDVICHGVPSPKIWMKYLEIVKSSCGQKIVSINQKDKEIGWKKPCIRIKLENDNTYLKKSSADAYMKLFNGNFSLRDSCYNCMFKGDNRLSDITLADFWGIENVFPEWDDGEGISLVIINTKKGEYLFNQIRNSIDCQEVDFSNATAKNPCYFQSVTKPTNVNEFWQDVNTGLFGEIVDKYCGVSKSNIIKSKIKDFLRI